MAKPEIGREATSICSGRAPRGDTGWRASKDRQGTWETRRGDRASGYDVRSTDGGNQ